MKKESQRPWPEVMFYAVFGEHGPESTIKPPKDFDLSLEFLMRNKLSEEDVMFLRERYEKGLSERAIAEQHNLTIGIARGKINKAIKRLRHPSRSIDGVSVDSFNGQTVSSGDNSEVTQNQSTRITVNELDSVPTRFMSRHCFNRF